MTEKIYSEDRKPSCRSCSAFARTAFDRLHESRKVRSAFCPPECRSRRPCRPLRSRSSRDELIASTRARVRSACSVENPTADKASPLYSSLGPKQEGPERRRNRVE